MVSAEGQLLEGVKLGAVFPNPKQPRRVFDNNALAELAESISKHGLIQPIVVVDRTEQARDLIAQLPRSKQQYVDPNARYMIVVGERRWRAGHLANMATLPLRLIQANDEDVFLLSVTENVGREDMLPSEEANAFKRLADEQGMSKADIARAVGVSASKVSDRIRLLDLADDILTMVDGGHVPITLAVQLAKLSENGQHRVLHIMSEEGLTTQEAIYVADKLYAEENQGEMFDLGAYMVEKAQEVSARWLAKAASTGQQLRLALHDAMQKISDPNALREHIEEAGARLEALLSGLVPALAGAASEDDEEPVTLEELVSQEPVKVAELLEAPCKKFDVTDDIQVRVVTAPTSQGWIAGNEWGQCPETHLEVVVLWQGKVVTALGAIPVTLEPDGAQALMLHLDTDFGRHVDDRWESVLLTLQRDYKVFWGESLMSADPDLCSFPLYGDDDEEGEDGDG